MTPIPSIPAAGLREVDVGASVSRRGMVQHCGTCQRWLRLGESPRGDLVGDPVHLGGYEVDKRAPRFRRNSWETWIEHD